MIDPLAMVERQPTLDEALARLRHELEKVTSQPNVDFRIRDLQEILTDVGLTRAQFGKEQELQQLEQEVNDRLLEMRNIQDQLERIEERLGSGSSEPVDLTLQQTLDVLDQLRQLAKTVPEDERLAAMGTNVSEGLESFVSSILIAPTSATDDNQPPPEIPNAAEFTTALEVIDAIYTCPGRDRASIYKSLRQQFVDAACYSAWKRLDRVVDRRLDKADKKQNLHEALTIWTLIPELSENSGSPRLSQLPTEMYQALQQLFLRDVIGDSTAGEPEKLVDQALMTKELTEDYLGMIPALDPEAPSKLANQAIESLVRRIKSELSVAKSWRDLDTCINATSMLGTISAANVTKGPRELSRAIRLARWRLRWLDWMALARKWALPAAIGVAALVLLLGVYVGMATLVEIVYGTRIPLGAS